MSTTSSIAKPDFVKDDVVGGWRVVRKLGSGGFGAVYEVERDGQLAALKTEFITEDRSESLRNEVQHLRLLQWSQHFCRLFMACRIEKENENDLNCMVMSLVGRPLSRLRRMAPERKFTKWTSLHLAKASLQPLEDMHSIGLLHRDIKGSNFAWSDEGRVYLIDLGFCRKFISVDEKGKASYRETRKKAPFLGTAKYCSVNVHNRIEQGRRDDLWAWFYMTVEFLVGRLKWSNDSDDSMMIRKQKMGSSLLNKCPRELYKIYDHIRSMDIQSKPNYDMMRRQIDEACTRLGFHHSDPLDWEMGGKFYEHYQGKSETERDMAVSSDNSESAECVTSTDVEVSWPEAEHITGESESALLPSLPTVSVSKQSQ